MFGWLNQIFRPRDVNENAVPGESFSAWFASAGVTVTPETALKLGAVWRAVNLIASSVGKTPCHFYKDDGRTRNRAVADPRYRLLRREPAEGITRMDFWQTLVAHVVHRGNGYAYLHRDPLTREVLELWIIPPEYVQPKREDGRITYLVKLNHNRAAEIPYFDMLHVKGLGYDGLVGYSVIEYMATDGGLAQAMRDYSADFFANGAAPDLIVSPGQILKAEEYALLKSSWNAKYGGQGRRHKTALSPAPLSVQTVTMNARDAQLIEARQFSIRDIANWYGVPPHKLGDTSRTAYNSLESENMSFLTDCLDSWLVKIEDELHAKLLSEAEKRAGQHFFEFKRDSWLSVQTSVRYSVLSKAVGAPWMTVNEARRIENMNPVDGGDRLLSPLNMSNGNADKGNDNEETDA
ncbi:MAG: phage portal protein [Lentisphaeria bacterium]|nr:phage portal protein [Lentisphaeria bacterium]